MTEVALLRGGDAIPTTGETPALRWWSPRNVRYCSVWLDDPDDPAPLML